MYLSLVACLGDVAIDHASLSRQLEDLVLALVKRDAMRKKRAIHHHYILSQMAYIRRQKKHPFLVALVRLFFFLVCVVALPPTASLKRGSFFHRTKPHRTYSTTEYLSAASVDHQVFLASSLTLFCFLSIE